MKTKTSRRNFLKKVGLVGVAGLGIGCSDDKMYHFNGIIDGEQIRFYEILGDNYLEVIKPDGRKITYCDYGFGIGSIEEIQIEFRGKKLKYSWERGKNPIIIEAERQYNNYLNKILKNNKTKEGMDLIKK